MTDDRRRRVEAIFLEIAGCPPESREALLGDRCGEDAELRAEIESLLSHLSKSGSGGAGRFLDPDELRAQRGGAEPVQDEALLPDTRIAEFTIIGKVGEGGMGVVYIAEQARPRRTVALKLIRRGLATSGMTRRFEHEAEVLGRLAHAGIAQIFEAGVAPTEHGVQPYIAMELIEGPPLTEFAAREKLSVRERVRLIVRVCDAVQHAHQRGVIHRDLKPSNILIAGAGQAAQPKVLDFGVARVVRDPREQHLTTLHTGVGQFVGTLAYMSPEQVLAEPEQVDTRSDVYALGVILFELITGKLPLDVRGRSIPEAARMIREDEPQRLGAIDRSLRGDLETIVAKALDKERERRYQSAAALGEDLQRYLDARPIVAKHDSALYVIRKQMRRHRWAVAAAGAFAVGLIWFGVYAAWQARVQSRLAESERKARIEADRARGQVDLKVEELRRNLYVSAIGFAEAAYASRDPDRMKRVLNSCPVELRGWEWRYLQFIADISSRVQTLPEGRASVGFLSGDGERMATFAGSSPVKLLDGKDGQSVAEFRLPNHARGVLFTRDHSHCVMVLSDNQIVVADERTGELRVVAGPSPANVLPFALTPDDGQMLVETVESGTLTQARVVDLRDGHTVRVVAEPGGFVGAISPDGKWAAIGEIDGRVRLCDLSGATADRVLHPHSMMVGVVAFSHDSTRLASGGYDGLVSVCDIATMRATPFPLSDNKLLVMAWSPDDRYLAASGTEPVIRVIDPVHPRIISTLFGHEARLQALAWSEHGVRSVARDGTMRWWNRPTAEAAPHRELAQEVDSACVDPQWEYVYAGLGKGQIVAMDARDLHTVFQLSRSAGQIDGLMCSPDGSLLVSCQETGDVVTYDVARREVLSSFKSPAGRAMEVAFDPSGQKVALGSDHKAVTIWDVRSGKLLVQGPPQSSVANCVAWAPDGSVIAAGHVDGSISLHDPADGRIIAELRGHDCFCFHMRFTPDSRLLCSGDECGLIIVWNMSTRAEAFRLVGHQNGVYSLGVSPDGTRLVTGGWDNTVRVWDLIGRHELLTLRGHISGIDLTAFSPDGESILSTSGEGSIKLWKAGSSPPAAEVRGASGG